MKNMIAGIFIAAALSVPAAAQKAAQAVSPQSALPVVVWQPSHQNDTSNGKSNEALVCDAIAQYAHAAQPVYDEYKVSSYREPGLHHSTYGTNTAVSNTSAVIDGKKSGYAFELEKSNEHHPLVFIALHNNAAAGVNAIWGYVHDGDKYEAANRELAGIIVDEIAAAVPLKNRGVHPDSSTGRNDYRCKATGRLAFYSIDENVNTAPYRVLLEIGDGDLAPQFLADKSNQRKIGEAVKKGLAKFISTHNLSGKAGADSRR
ncbi:MAG: N-acetylmuramoyl-L-alanine amidase [Elusimicrobiales bacterium]|nr:N-acetylmuramoyl-L-alanine amidase [Elusimicrobiales bacterium]